MRRNAATLGGMLALVFALVGCTEPAAPDPDPTASGDAVFASEEEALAAAEEAYAAYLSVSNAVGGSGWDDPDRLSEVATGDALQAELSSAEAARERGLTQRGETTFDSGRLQDFESDGTGVTIYLCVDSTAVDIVDSTGASVSGQASRTAIVATLSGDSGGLLLSENVPWSGDDFC